jgi:hypothetical protein
MAFETGDVGVADMAAIGDDEQLEAGKGIHLCHDAPAARSGWCF